MGLRIIYRQAFLEQTPVYFRFLPTGGVHPLAQKQGEVVFPSFKSWLELPQWSYSIRVCGDFVGILRKVQITSQFCIWNWKTSTLLMVHSYLSHPPPTDRLPRIFVELK